MGRPGIYLEDLFVQPEFRGLGIGKALLQRVAAIAVEKDCPRLQWEVLDWNTPAIDFYRAMGAEFLDEWRNVRVSGEALKRLAAVARRRCAGDAHSENSRDWRRAGRAGGGADGGAAGLRSGSLRDAGDGGRQSRG